MSIEFKIRDFAYPYSIFKLRRFFEKSQFFSKAEMENYQLERLHIILKHAIDNVPFYAGLFQRENIKSSDICRVSDMPLIPRLTKNDLQKNPHMLTAKNASRCNPVNERTSGSSGIPCHFLSDKHSRILEFVYYWRHWSWAGYKLGDRFAELSSHYFALSPERRCQITSFNRLTGRILLNSLKISPDNIESFIHVIRKNKPRFLKGVASAIFFFAFWINEKSVNDISFQAIFSTGEKLTKQYRQLIEKVFHCKVLDSYGHMERTVTISQCLEGAYHINSDYGILELQDSGPSGNGETRIGSVVGTSLYNLAMPLIRYELGDLIEFYPDPLPDCACGRTLPIIKSISGRHEDVIITPDDCVITSIYISLNLVKGFSFGQFIQEKKESLQIHLIKDKNFEENDSREFLNVLRNFVGKDMKILLRYITTEQIIKEPSGKIPIVISRIKPRDMAGAH